MRKTILLFLSTLLIYGASFAQSEEQNRKVGFLLGGEVGSKSLFFGNSQTSHEGVSGVATFKVEVPLFGQRLYLRSGIRAGIRSATSRDRYSSRSSSYNEIYKTNTTHWWYHLFIETPLELRFPLTEDLSILAGGGFSLVIEEFSSYDQTLQEMDLAGNLIYESTSDWTYNKGELFEKRFPTVHVGFALNLTPKWEATAIYQTSVNEYDRWSSFSLGMNRRLGKAEGLKFNRDLKITCSGTVPVLMRTGVYGDSIEKETTYGIGGAGGILIPWFGSDNGKLRLSSEVQYNFDRLYKESFTTYETPIDTATTYSTTTMRFHRVNLRMIADYNFGSRIKIGAFIEFSKLIASFTGREHESKYTAGGPTQEYSSRWESWNNVNYAYGKRDFDAFVGLMTSYQLNEKFSIRGLIKASPLFHKQDILISTYNKYRQAGMALGITYALR